MGADGRRPEEYLYDRRKHNCFRWLHLRLTLFPYPRRQKRKTRRETQAAAGSRPNACKQMPTREWAMNCFLKTGIAAGILTLSAAGAFAGNGDTLKTVKQRGELLCPGHNGSYLGFAETDDRGNWKGIDIELCRAIGTAILGDPSKVRIIPLSWEQRWPSLQSGDVDIMIKASGGTLSRDTDLNMQFSNSYYLGTTRVLAHKELELESLKDAEGGTICVMAGTSQEKQLTSYLQQIGIEMEVVAIERTSELEGAYFSGRCDTYIQWGPVLAVSRAASNDPEAHVMLPDIVALEPSVMLMRQGDDNWVDIANWTLSALLFAEQEGITSENIDEMKANPPTVEVGKFLGATPGMGAGLGLSDDWAYNVIKKVGNYSEIFERSLGQESPYKMDRELTALWKDGGVLFPYIID
ncbi:amino acid ABC transporter substrate-binding protein (plasmid) [Paracoccus sp. MA]|uniref:amino acid ABC transporter substrate-binding protein n=2 Tax=Paracoccus TaxID=265 RepID=UPI001E49B743|nr:amino acid ABC transporter substrate-binding protein [Paracoccus sp. MA]UFM67127.1 amino acid ABC transporter substrate-binding protein [Paracoccus sp. MA]